MDQSTLIRKQLIEMMRGGQAFETFDEIVGQFAPMERGVAPDGAEKSAWRILGHIVIAQRDILDFSRNETGEYKDKNWPEDYWPKDASPANDAEWNDTVAAYHADVDAFEQFVADERVDLTAPFPWGDGQTVLHEAILATQHAAYHLGQLVLLKRLIAARNDAQPLQPGLEMPG